MIAMRRPVAPMAGGDNRQSDHVIGSLHVRTVDKISLLMDTVLDYRLSGMSDGVGMPVTLRMTELSSRSARPRLQNK